MFFLARSPATYLPSNASTGLQQPVIVPISDSAQALPWFVATYQVGGAQMVYWETVSCTDVIALVQHLKRQLRLGAAVAHLLYLGPHVRDSAWLHWKQRSVRKIEVGKCRGSDVYVLWQGWTEEWTLGLPDVQPDEVKERQVLLDLSKVRAGAASAAMR